MLTPRDLEKPSNLSGYKNVGLNGDVSDAHPYQAFDGRAEGATRKHVWKGPRRSTALAAAQDYCDYKNGNVLFLPSAPTLKSVNHPGKRQSIAAAVVHDPDYRAALGYLKDVRAQEQGKQGYVYLIAETSAVTRGVDLLYGYAKIGYSTNPQARVPELQTGNPRPLKLLGFKKGTVEDEAALHAKYLPNNVLQEWFRLTPALVAEFPSDAKGKV